MGTLLLVTIIIFLALALLPAFVEAGGNYLGDSSLVPGCLVVMVIVLAVIVAVGLCLGNIVFHIT